MLVGQKNAEKIEALDLPMPEYSAVYQAIMGVASGTYEEEATVKHIMIYLMTGI